MARAGSLFCPPWGEKRSRQGGTAQLSLRDLHPRLLTPNPAFCPAFPLPILSPDPDLEPWLHREREGLRNGRAGGRGRGEDGDRVGVWVGGGGSKVGDQRVDLDSNQTLSHPAGCVWTSDRTSTRLFKSGESDPFHQAFMRPREVTMTNTTEHFARHRAGPCSNLISFPLGTTLPSSFHYAHSPDETQAQRIHDLPEAGWVSRP